MLVPLMAVDTVSFSGVARRYRSAENARAEDRRPPSASRPRTLSDDSYFVPPYASDNSYTASWPRPNVERFSRESIDRHNKLIAVP
jgi:hypothetical protein